MLRALTLLLALLWLAPTTLPAAELTLSSLAVDNITHSSARVCWTTTAGVNASKQLAFDTTTNFSVNHSLADLTVGDSAKSWSTMCMALSGLTANTSYTTCPSITDGSGNSTNCTSAGNPGSRATFPTSVLPSPHPALPAPPATFDTSYPSVDVTLTVATDCGNLASIITAAYGAGNANKTVKIVYTSFRTQTSTACNSALDISNNVKSGTGYVIFASSDEANLPAPGVRIDPTFRQYTSVLNAVGSTPALLFSGSTQTRFVGFTLQPADSEASNGNGDPAVTEYLTRFDLGAGTTSNIIFDRCVLDGRGYPYRIKFAAYGKGNNIGFINNYFNRIEVWEPWVDTTSISISGNQIISSLAFLMGRGDATVTVPTFTVTQTSGTGNAYLSVRTGGTVEYRYSVGVASCTGCTPVLDANLTLPADARTLMWNHSTRQIAYAAGTFGGQLFRSHSNVPDLNSWSGIQDDPEWSAFGINSDGSGGTSQTWIIQNNFIGVTGFGVFPTGTNMTTSDWTISGNTFQSNNSCLVAFGTISASSNPYVCLRRHHFETKNGFRFSITNNIMSNGFVAIGGNGAYAVDIKQDYIGSVSAVSDMYVGYNTITNEASCFYVAGDSNNSTATSYTKLIARVLIEQNICQPNAFARSQFFAAADQGTLTNGGLTLYIEEETEDIIVRHNTIYQPRGSYTSIVLFADRWSEGLTLQNNIFFLNGPYLQGRGIITFGNIWGVNSTPAFVAASGSDGTVALNDAILPNSTWSVQKNVFIAACLDPSTCNDLTGAGSLVGDLSGQYPGPNFWITSGNYGARQDAVGWINRASVPGGLYLTRASAYANAGTDGLDIGVTVPVNSGTVVSGSVVRNGVVIH